MTGCTKSLVSQSQFSIFLVIPPIFSVSSETLIVLRFILNLQSIPLDSSSVVENIQVALLEPSVWSQTSTFFHNLNSVNCAVTRLHYGPLVTYYTDILQFDIFKMSTFLKYFFMHIGYDNNDGIVSKGNSLSRRRSPFPPDISRNILRDLWIHFDNTN